MKKTYHIITIGCQMNKSDSERIAAYLESYGFKNEPERKKSGIVVINTCGVRQSAEDRNYGLIPGIKKENPRVKIILAGCLSEEKKIKERLGKKVDIWLPIKNLPFLYKELGLKSPKYNKKDYLCIKPKINSSFSALIPIGNGCNNFCSYCFVPFARGRELYRKAHEVLEESEKFIKNGYKEIILIAQNVNSYYIRAEKKDIYYFKNKKIGDLISFSELIKRVSEIEGDFWLRFSTSHPKDFNDSLIDVILKNRKICRHIHLPAQAGDDKILSLMNRKYTHKHYLALVKKIINKISDVSITTDFIVGFPSETKKQFANTLKLCREIDFDMIYIGKFSPRPLTAAAKMKDNVSREEKKRREKELMKTLRKTALKNSEKFINKKIIALIEQKGKNGEWIGKNEQNKIIKIKNKKSNQNLLGKFVFVKILKAEDFGLEGELI